MTSPKASLANRLLIGYLFAVLATVSLRCYAEETERARGSGGGGGGPFDALGNFGDFSKLGDSGLGSMFKSMTDGGNSALTDFMGSFAGPKVLQGASATSANGNNNADKREGNSDSKEDAGFMGIKEPMDFFKLMLNPMDFIARLAKQFKLDKGEFTQAVGRGMNVGLETALQPPMVCIKVIEKVFVPDACKLKFVCEMGKQMAMFKGQMPKFPDSYFDGASTAKALYDGASGRECEHVYACREGEGPKLKKEFAGLKQKFNGGGEHDSGEFAAAASQPSRVMAEPAAPATRS